RIRKNVEGCLLWQVSLQFNKELFLKFRSQRIRIRATHQMSLWDMGQTIRIFATHQMSLWDMGRSLKSLVASNNFQRLNIRSHSGHWWVEKSESVVSVVP